MTVTAGTTTVAMAGPLFMTKSQFICTFLIECSAYLVKSQLARSLCVCVYTVYSVHT